MKIRNSNIELLRIILLGFLIFTHIGGYIIPGGTDKLPLSIAWINKISIISVDCFALITGYFMFGSSKTRVKKYSIWLALLLVFSLIAYTSILLPLGLWKFNYKNVMEILTFGSWNNWYLWSILGIYILGPLVSRGLETVKASTQISMAVFLFMFSIGLMWVNGWLKTEFVQIFGPGRFMWVFVVFFIGHTIAKTNNKWWLIWSGVVALICFIVWYVYFSLGNYNVYTNNMLAAGHASLSTLSMSIFVFSIFIRLNFKSKIINNLSKRMIYVYPLHHIFILVFRAKVSPHFNYYQIYFLAWIFIFSLTTILSIVISYPMDWSQKGVVKLESKLMKYLEGRKTKKI